MHQELQEFQQTTPSAIPSVSRYESQTKAERTELPINIEGEARSVEPARNPKGNSERDVDRDSERDSGRNAEREAAIRPLCFCFISILYVVFSVNLSFPFLFFPLLLSGILCSDHIQFFSIRSPLSLYVKCTIILKIIHHIHPDSIKLVLFVRKMTDNKKEYHLL